MKTTALFCLFFAAAVAQRWSFNGTINLSATSISPVYAGYNIYSIQQVTLNSFYLSVYSPINQTVNVTISFGVNLGWNFQNGIGKLFSGFLNVNEGLKVQFENDAGCTANLTANVWAVAILEKQASALQLWGADSANTKYGLLDASFKTKIYPAPGITKYTYVFPLPTPLSRTYTFADVDFSISGRTGWIPRLYNVSFGLDAQLMNYTFDGSSNFTLQARGDSAQVSVGSSVSFGAGKPNGAGRVVSPYFTIGSSGSVDASLYFNYSAAKLAYNFDTQALVWFRFSNGQWERFNSTVDTNGQLVIARTNKFSTWVVAESDKNSAAVAGASLLLAALAVIAAL